VTTFVVGDIQGCLGALHCVLEKAGFQAGRDRLWCAGDLVNRGPDSLGTLRFLYSMRADLVTVLGNHDLHLLAVAAGVARLSRGDNLQPILEAADRDLLLDWLRQQPLLHRDQGATLVHAGILPNWSVAKATTLASEVETALRGPDYREFLAAMYGNEPALWHDSLTGPRRLRLITNILTRMRFCRADGSLDLRSKGPRPDPDSDARAWFSHWPRLPDGERILFGHWAALEGRSDRDDIVALDTGCVWGGALSLYALDTGRWTRCDCAAA